MTDRDKRESDRSWQRFVVDHGHRAALTDLAAILGQPVKDIDRLRRTGVCTKSGAGKKFAELFFLWHGREPAEEDWPAPRVSGGGWYEWQGRELTLLASLVGLLGKTEIAQILTERLQQLTGDASASRTMESVQLAIGRIGMQTGDVVGGISTTEAAREIGSRPIIYQAIRTGDLRTIRVGRLLLIPHAAWAAWKATRTLPPAGFVPLATLKQTLSIRSDKLSEFARLGFVPTTVRCNPCGKHLPSTRFGSWYIDPTVAEQLVADRHAGRPMPWHGKPLSDNLRVTYERWQERKHPPACPTCAAIWGKQGAPSSFEDYADRYPPLAHGAKRHLTLRCSPSFSVPELARKAGRSVSLVRRAIANGAVNAQRHSGNAYITKTDATRWINRRCPVGDKQHSWISVATASKRYLFSKRQLTAFIAQDRLKSKTGTHGAMRGIVYVAKHQCATLREEIGFTEQEAARRVGVTIPEFRAALVGVDWRGTGAIPLVTVQAVIKRLRARPGHTIEEAAAALGEDVAWIDARIKDGTVRPLPRRSNPGELYLSEPMIRRLRDIQANPPPPIDPTADLLRLSDAASEAGVTPGTIIKWAKKAELARVHKSTGWHYPRDAVRARARQYWAQIRFRRATPPHWLQTPTNV